MQKLKSFDQFSTEAKISQTRQLEEDKTSKRQNEAETFKTLLAEFDVTSIKDLTKEQRVEFFTKLKGTELNESISLIEEGTRGQIGKIDKKGNITSVYMQYDSYPENILPLIKKGFKDGKNVDELVKKGSFSGLEASIDKISFYGKPGHMTGSAATDADVKKYLTKTSNEESAEFVYLWDENAKQWLMSDNYANTGLVPAFESLVTEGQHGMAKKLLQDIIKGDTSRAEGTKMSKDLAEHFLMWVESSPFGKKNGNLPLNMLIKASFNWGIERGLNPKLKDELAALKDSVKESFIFEAEVKSDEEFNEYAMSVLKKAFGAEFDEAKAQKVIDGILSKSKGDYGTAIGMLTSSLGESVVIEALKASKPNDVETIELDMAWDEQDKDEDKAAKGAFKKYKITVKGANGQPGTYEVTGKKKDILAYIQSEFYEMDDETVEEYYPELLEGHSYEVHTIKEFKASNESIDTKYWADYNTDTSGQGNKEFANKSKDFEDTFSLAVSEWNAEADGAENRIKGSQIDKVKKLAQEFFKKEGYISVNIAQAMIAQES